MVVDGRVVAYLAVLVVAPALEGTVVKDGSGVVIAGIYCNRSAPCSQRGVNRDVAL